MQIFLLFSFDQHSFSHRKNVSACRLPKAPPTQKKYFISQRFCQGWEFTHRFFEQIARFLRAKEQFTLKRANGSWSLFCHEQTERITHGRPFVTSDERANRSQLLNNMSDFEQNSDRANSQPWFLPLIKLEMDSLGNFWVKIWYSVHCCPKGFI